MARLVAAFGSSHSIMLVAQREDWQHQFRLADTKNPHLYDKAGNKTDYVQLLAGMGTADQARAAALTTPEKLGDLYDQAQKAMDALRERIASAGLDVLIIVGDDQTELFRTSNNPAFAIYYGKTIRNTVREPAFPQDAWVKSARMWRHEPEADRDYPVKSDLAEWLIRQLCDRDFDIAAMDGLEKGQSEGHAFQFIHRRLLDGKPGGNAGTLAVIPVILNTFDPPNQPTPKRCIALGAALRELIALWPQDLRVGVIASGGLSHFVVDEELDQKIIQVIRNKDSATLAALDPKRLQAGSSEIRNWLVVAEMARTLDVDWVEYLPGYRSEALTGTGLCFMVWKTLSAG
jgi:3-O-methylgallate 3,4-dioxygenase